MNNNLEAGEFNIELKEEEPVWMDKKRYTIFALPISFTTYYLTPTKILIESGLFTTREDEIMLYRIRDISATQNIFEKLNKTGTIRICSSDVGTPELLIQHVKNYRKDEKPVVAHCDVFSLTYINTFKQDGLYLRDGELWVNPSAEPFFSIQDALDFIPLENICGVLLPNGEVYL